MRSTKMIVLGGFIIFVTAYINIVFFTKSDNPLKKTNGNTEVSQIDQPKEDLPNFEEACDQLDEYIIKIKESMDKALLELRTGNEDASNMHFRTANMLREEAMQLLLLIGEKHTDKEGYSFVSKQYPDIDLTEKLIEINAPILWQFELGNIYRGDIKKAYNKGLEESKKPVKQE